MLQSTLATTTGYIDTISFNYNLYNRFIEYTDVK